MDQAYQDRFDRALEGLLAETYNLLSCQAAMEVLVEALQAEAIHPSPLLATVLSGLKSDRLIRLIRIFEEDTETATFWYLYRCQPKLVGLGIDINCFQALSRKLKHIRDKSFVHIDKGFVSDRQRAYQEAELTPNEMIRAMETIWNLLNRLNGLRGLPKHSMAEESLIDFREIFRRDIHKIHS